MTSRFTGWRGGVHASFIGVAICLTIELIFMIIVFRLGVPEDGLGTLYEGDCNHVRNLIIYLLIPLNIVGTISIGSSNYVMQCLMAPTRKEVDEAHARGLFASIGVSSMHNMSWLSTWKCIAWWALGVSTVPIHLLLNSAVFSTLQSNNYAVVIASVGFQEDPSWDVCPEIVSSNMAADFVCKLAKSIQEDPANYTKLNAGECISHYANPLQDTSSNVILVTNSTSGSWANLGTGAQLPNNLDFDPSDGYLSVSWTVQQTGRTDLSYSTSSNNGLFVEANDNVWNITSLRAVFTALDFRRWTIAQALNYNQTNPKAVLENQWNPATWLCDTEYTMAAGECSLNAVAQNATRWEVSPASFVIDHCLAQSSGQRCTVQYSLHIFVALICCDLVKLLSIGFTLRSALTLADNHNEISLTTIGDAVASFLDTPDETSAGRCLLDAKQIRNLSQTHHGPVHYWEQVPLQKRITIAPKWFGPRPLPWKAEKRRCISVPSRTRWFFFSIL